MIMLKTGSKKMTEQRQHRILMTDGKQACEFPELAEKDRFQAIHQEIVKMKSIPEFNINRMMDE